MTRAFTSPAAAFLAALTVLFLRRRTALTNPQVWDEEGVMLIPDFLARGWSVLFEPYQAYVMTLPRVFINAVVTLAPHDYPLVATTLAWLFIAATVAFIAAAPTTLRGGLLLAFACLLVPTDPEVFGTVLYVSWWAGLAILLLPFWEDSPRHFVLRCGVLLIGGLSSPEIVLITPLLLVRAALRRTRTDIALAGLAVACAAIQGAVAVMSRRVSLGNAVTPDGFVQVIRKFFGWFVWDTRWYPGSDGLSYVLIAGGILIAALAYAAWRTRNPYLAWGMLFLIAGNIYMSITRIGIAPLQPAATGPRYFFYPYVLIAWLLVAAVCAPGRWWARALPAVLLVFGFVNAVTSGWSRDHADIQWTRNLASCVHFTDYSMPIQFDGSANFWYHTYTREQCRVLGGEASELDEPDLFLFTVRMLTPPAPAARPPVIAAQTAIESRSIDGVEYLQSSTGDEASTLTTSMKRGDHVVVLTSDRANGLRYRVEAPRGTVSGVLPLCREACLLDFSSDLLPEQFTVTFLDEGRGPDDWFAIGSPSQK